jgi:hypothetical protein
VFSAKQRDAVRAAILEAAESDARISGGAITGSAAGGTQDEWSDVDVAFGVRQGSSVDSVLADFTDLMYRRFDARHHVDVRVPSWIYRVFLLPSTLQVDIAVAPQSEFGARSPRFRLVFGEAADLPPPSPATAEGLIGLAWLLALHVRSSLERGKLWSAEFFVSWLRDQILALACLRHGLPVTEARGVDQLPSEVARPFEETLVRSLDRDELRRAFMASVNRLLVEARLADPTLADRIEPALRETAGLDPPTNR